MSPKKLRLLVVSSVIPENTQGGQLALLSILSYCNIFDVTILAYQVKSSLNHRIIPATFVHRLIARLCRLPFFSSYDRVLYSFAPWLYNYKLIRTITQDIGPDFILTVAHGNLWKCAHTLSRDLKVPLIVILHDWWPDLVSDQIPIPEFCFRNFLKLLKDAYHVFTVSSLAQKYLPASTSYSVLPPLPYSSDSASLTNLSHTVQDPKHTLKYAGNLGEYSKELISLCKANDQLSTVNLKIAGNSNRWPSRTVTLYKNKGILFDYLQKHDYLDWLNDPSLHLVVMSFADFNRRHAEISFPSKILHYCKLGVPFVIWAPNYSSAAQWAITSGFALYHTSSSPYGFLEFISKISFADLATLRLQAYSYYLDHYRLEPIGQMFIDSIVRQ